MTLVPKNKTAWFSSSVPKSAVHVWVQLGGVVKSNYQKADFVFAENSEVDDVQRLFKSKEFLNGHLTVFSSNVVRDTVIENLNHFDIGKYIILPQKELGESGISVPVLKEDAVAQTFKTYEDSSDSIECGPNTLDVPPETVGKRKKTSCYGDTLTNNTDCDADDAPRPLKSVDRVSNSKDGTLDSSCTRSIFYHSLNFDVVHLDDIHVPPVRLMDFKPGINGCRVVKRKTSTCQKHSSEAS